MEFPKIDDGEWIRAARRERRKKERPLMRAPRWVLGLVLFLFLLGLAFFLEGLGGFLFVLLATVLGFGHGGPPLC